MNTPQKRRIAVFDVDGTIFRSSLFIQLVRHLIEQKKLPESMYRAYAREEKKWVNREGSYDAYIEAMVHASKRYFHGLAQDDFSEAARFVVEAQWKHVYRYTRGLLKDLKERRYYLLAVSHSPKVILDYFCPRLGFDKTYGIIYEVDSKNSLTGKVIDAPVILNKANILNRVVRKQSLTLKGSVGVGDSESDIPFLKLVEKPICFNPSSALYRHAKKQNWKTVVERKDVIYEL